jgi:DNA-binding SARP family transcriptional activator
MRFPQLQFIGRLTFEGEGPIPIEIGGKPAAVLFLATLEQPVTRETAATLLWPKVNARIARTNLRVTLHRLRKRLGVQVLAERPILGFDEGIEVDLIKARGGELSAQQALALLKCPLLVGDGEFDDCEEFTEILLAERRAWRHKAKQVAHAHALELIEKHKDPERATRFLQELLLLDPVNESSSRLLMELFFASGNRVEALTVYERLRREVAWDLGIHPDPQTESLHHRILRSRAATGHPTELSIRDQSVVEVALIERESQLQRMWQAIAEQRGVLLEGDAGLGKTRLMRQVLKAGHSDLYASARPGDRDKPLSLIRRLVESLLGSVENLMPLASRARLAVLARPALATADDDGACRDTALLAAVLDILLAARGNGVGVIGLDDLHWADAPSIRLLQEVLEATCYERDERQERLYPVFLLAYRPQELTEPLIQLLAPAGLMRDFEHVLLPTLSAEGVRTLIRSLELPWITGKDDLSEELHQKTGGNPYFVIEVAREARWAEGAPGFLALPAGVVALFQARLARLSSAALDLLELAFCAGSDFSSAIAEALVDGEERKLTKAWAELRLHGFFDTGGFAHDLARVACETQFSGPARSGLHGRIAKELIRLGALPERIADHLLLAGQPNEALPWVHLATQRQILQEHITEEPEALIARTVDNLSMPLGSAAQSTLFECLCLRLKNLHILWRPKEILEVANRLVELARTREERVIAACHLSFALQRVGRADESVRVCEQLTVRPGKRLNWLFRVIYCFALANVSRDDEADAIYPGPPKPADILERKWGIPSYTVLGRCCLSLGRLMDGLKVLDLMPRDLGTPWGPSYERALVYYEMGHAGEAEALLRVVHSSVERFGRAGTAFSTYLLPQILELQILQGDLAGASALNQQLSLDRLSGFAAARLFISRATLAHALDDDETFAEAYANAGPLVDHEEQDRITLEGLYILRLLRRGHWHTAMEHFKARRELGRHKSPWGSAFALLGCRLIGADEAQQVASEVMNSKWDKERQGLQLLAQLELAAAWVRLGRFTDASTLLFTLRSRLLRVSPPILWRGDVVCRALEIADELRSPELSEMVPELTGWLHSRQRGINVPFEKVVEATAEANPRER